jgi:hypothetical protein
MKTTGGKKRTTISISTDLLKKGEKRARHVRRNFSNYIETLIEADITLSGEKIPSLRTRAEAFPV